MTRSNEAAAQKAEHETKAPKKNIGEEQRIRWIKEYNAMLPISKELRDQLLGWSLFGVAVLAIIDFGTTHEAFVLFGPNYFYTALFLGCIFVIAALMYVSYECQVKTTKKLGYRPQGVRANPYLPPSEEESSSENGMKG